MGARNSSVLAQANGSYYCVFTDNNGCSINSDTVNVIITNLKEVKGESFSIFPNPSNGSFVITPNNDYSIEKIEMLDLTGKLVWSKEILEKSQQIRLNLSLTKGIYIIRAHNSEGIIQKKLLIE